jgi:heme exporter protein A
VTAPRLEVRSLAASRGPAQLFRGVTFTLAAGEIAALRGPNGSGKTTLLRCVAGLTRPDAGEILREGALIYAGHLPGIKDDLNAEENLAIALRMRGIMPGDGAVRRALSRVGLEARRAVPARRLSAGQRRRIGLARLQLDPAPLWILDEPLAALDAEGEAMLGECLVRHQDSGGIALVATHHELPLSGRTVRELGLRP